MNAPGKPMKAGIQMPSADYHAHPAIGKSTLDLIARDPHLVEWARHAPQDASKTSALDFGDAMHAILLEPERLTADFAVAPELNLRTNDGKAEYKRFVEQHAGKTILDHDDYRKLQLMLASVRANRQAMALLEGDEGFNEHSWFWTDRETGLECKCRPDRYIPSRALLIDVKTTPDISKFKFSVEDYRYYVQDAWYCDGMAANGIDCTMAFLVVQTSIECGRYPVQVVTLPQETFLYGQQIYRRDLNRYAAFLANPRNIDTLVELPMHERFLTHCLDSLEITT